MVQAVHDLFDAGGVVPPVHIEDVDVRRAQLLERIFSGEVHRFGVVPDVVGLLAYVLGSLLVISCVLQTEVSPGEQGAWISLPQRHTFVAMTS